MRCGGGPRRCARCAVLSRCRWETTSQSHTAIALAGRRDYIEGINDESDCDIGLGALFSQNPAAATLLKSCLLDRLVAVLSKTDFEVNGHPQLQGRWGNGRMTLTQQSVANGMLGMQLELSMRLRKELNKNKKLRQEFAAGIAGAYREALRRFGAQRRGLGE